QSDEYRRRQNHDPLARPDIDRRIARRNFWVLWSCYQPPVQQARASRGAPAACGSSQRPRAPPYGARRNRSGQHSRPHTAGNQDGRPDPAAHGYRTRSVGRQRHTYTSKTGSARRQSMNWILASIHAHTTAWVLGSYFIFSNAISAMPSPANTSGGFYRWLFDFSHLLSGNITRIIATRYPQANTSNGGFTTGQTKPGISSGS